PPIRAARAATLELGGKPTATIVGGGRTSPDRAALVNGAAIRYLDFNDCYLGPQEACHPSDNLAPVLAAAEFANRDGRELLTALAVAYQVQVRLSRLAPVRPRGFDHTTQGAYAVAAGVSRALGLDAGQAAHAIAIAGTALNALRVTRTGAISNWKGLAYANTAFGAVNAVFLARHGITGPREVFEGSRGLMDSISGSFHIDWLAEGLDAVGETDLKRYAAEGHAQSVLAAVLDLRRRHAIAADDVEAVDVWVAHATWEIVGPGAGDKTNVTTREEADHSLPFVVAVAMLDGDVMPEQYEATRLAGADVQSLLRRVTVQEDPQYTKTFPARHDCRIRVRLRDGRTLEATAAGWPGFHGRPIESATVEEKFDHLTRDRLDRGLRGELVDAVGSLETLPARELTRLLALVPEPSAAAGEG
ncbi:MAG: MmgE/PrpD family protein, partial [Candidatus Dormiibacterota bacterium]